VRLPSGTQGRTQRGRGHTAPTSRRRSATDPAGGRGGDRPNAAEPEEARGGGRSTRVVRHRVYWKKGRGGAAGGPRGPYTTASAEGSQPEGGDAKELAIRIRLSGQQRATLGHGQAVHLHRGSGEPRHGLVACSCRACQRPLPCERGQKTAKNVEWGPGLELQE
jgi:hypothetical protein